MKIRIIILTTLFIFLSGCGTCQWQPKLKDYSLTSCYQAADCLYRNQDNKDKSICSDYISECNAFSKYEY